MAPRTKPATPRQKPTDKDAEMPDHQADALMLMGQRISSLEEEIQATLIEGERMAKSHEITDKRVRFTFSEIPVDDEDRSKIERFRKLLAIAAETLNSSAPSCNDTRIAISHLRDAFHWGEDAIKKKGRAIS